MPQTSRMGQPGVHKRRNRRSIALWEDEVPVKLPRGTGTLATLRQGISTLKVIGNTMQIENSRESQLEKNLATVVKSHTDRLQEIGDHRRVSDVVYGWLKQNNVDIHEDGAEQLVGYLSAIVGRARAGQDRPTNAEVRASLEASNRFAEEHNASAKTTFKLQVLDLAALPEVLVG
jgi:hypothetical protein